MWGAKIYKFLFIGGLLILLLTGVPGAAMFGGAIWKLPIFIGAWGLTILFWIFAQWEPKALVKRRYQPTARHLFSDAVMTLMLSGYVFLALCWANKLLDFDPTYSVEVQVSDVGQRHVRRLNFEFILVGGWPVGEDALELQADCMALSELTRGDQLELKVGDGLFGIPYVVDYRKID
ncbi:MULTISPECIES: hypothetical protein [Kordiimonas]|uniref:hypothetical protein n=1 Tax=Kordiimonas TaxID=288021 RepID=UPI00257BD0AF|nr:hypothetical protein [Kordiimonas sp. UBA4487]